MTTDTRAIISSIQTGSPFDDAGFTPGYAISSINGEPLRDVIDWRWQSTEDDMLVSYVGPDGESGSIELFRDEGEPWGLEFSDVVFDRVKTCKNNCVFCFMKQLPKGLRPSLYLRDDDFRLSFMSGTFVTLTNLTAADEDRIISQHLSPLRFSLHASNRDVRASMVGKHAERGIEALERLLDAGIEFHAQIVLCPGLNDNEVLEETLDWAYERPGILNIGIVPLGFSKHQSYFTESFNNPSAARKVLETLELYQERAWNERQNPWVYAADEFYVNAYGHQVIDNIPLASFYENCHLFEDGIGMLRACKDSWYEAYDSGLTSQFYDCALQSNTVVVMIFGQAMNPFQSQMIQRLGLEEVLQTLYIDNYFFGGNVNITGLLTGSDIARGLQEFIASIKDETSPKQYLFAVPRVTLNDDGLFLDDVDLLSIEAKTGLSLRVVSCNPAEYIDELAHILG